MTCEHLFPTPDGEAAVHAEGLADARPTHQVSVLVRTPAGRVLTRNPSWFEVTPADLRGYFMPDDDDSTICVDDITP